MDGFNDQNKISIVGRLVGWLGGGWVGLGLGLGLVNCLSGDYFFIHPFLNNR